MKKLLILTLMCFAFKAFANTVNFEKPHENHSQYCFEFTTQEQDAAFLGKTAVTFEHQEYIFVQNIYDVMWYNHIFFDNITCRFIETSAGIATENEKQRGFYKQLILLMNSVFFTNTLKNKKS